MKKLLCFLLVIAILFSSGGAIARSPLTIEVNGKVTDVNPPAYIKGGRTYVPLRYVTEALGFSLDWFEDRQSIVIEKPGLKTLTLTVGKATALYGEKEIPIDAPPEIRGDRAFVPLRVISETLGYRVDWDNQSKTVSIQ